MCYIGILRRQAFKTVSRGGLVWFECARFSRLRWILHAFSTRRGAASRAPSAGLNLGFTVWDRRARVEQNRRLFFAQLGAQRFALASLRQIHSSHVFQVASGATEELEYRPCGILFPEQRDKTPPAGDAVLTDQARILLSVRTADCLPILVVDPKRRAVGAVHAGWRGALARIIEKAVGEMRRLFGSQPERLLAAVGPSIHSCCYGVGEEVVEAFHGRFARAERFFRTAFPLSETLAGRSPLLSLQAQPRRRGLDAVPLAHLDLVTVAREQLWSAGLLPRNIFAAELCTACRTELFFSHRKEGIRAGRMMAVIGIRPDAQE